jgi:imidazolonepropionase-like amidohydrolase
MVASLRFAAAGTAGLVAAIPLAAQKQVPATYAITGARIVPVTGPVIEKGTIVIRDGVIAAVGASVHAPADARAIDGAGLTVYPGFIDAYTSLGQVTAAAGGNAPGGGRGGAATATPAPNGAPNSNYPAGLQPEIMVVGELKAVAGEFDAAHAAGFTTALTGAPAGIFRGQSALINLGGDDVSAMIVKSPVAQNIGFARGGGRGGYPGSLMGTFSALRQELLDAQHYRDVKAAYDRNPRGMKRPDYDPSLEALQAVLSRQQPAILQANTEREIARALDLAKEFNLRPMIAGGAEAYKVTARLKADNVPVLLSLSFPRAGAGGGGGFGGRGGGDPTDPEPIRTLRDRVMAPKGPGILAKDGVRFVFESGSDVTNAIANLRKAVGAGLPAEQALRALTTQPAELFGVSDRLGSIETGKIANLTIARGDLFDPTTRVTQLFVDGKPITVTQATAPAGGNGGGRGGRPGTDASGAWSMTVSIDGQEHRVTVQLLQYDDELTGAVQGTLGSSEVVDGYIARDGSFSFIASVSLKSGTTQAEFTGTIDRTGMHGQVAAEGHRTGSFSGSHTN